MSKFKVGDVVRVIKADRTDKNWYDTGDIGRIVDVSNPNSIQVNFSGYGNKRVVENGIWHTSSKKVELYKLVKRQTKRVVKPKKTKDTRSEFEISIANLILG